MFVHSGTFVRADPPDKSLAVNEHHRPHPGPVRLMPRGCLAPEPTDGLARHREYHCSLVESCSERCTRLMRTSNAVKYQLATFMGGRDTMALAALLLCVAAVSTAEWWVQRHARRQQSPPWYRQHCCRWARWSEHRRLEDSAVQRIR